MKTQEDNYTETFTGLKFNFLDPQCSQISIFDIARGLSMQCRYTGQCRRFYSIAEHSLLVSGLCSDKNKLYGLLHDASEAYISDIASPIKALLPEYIKLEDNIQNKIIETFCINNYNKSEIKYWDIEVLRSETKELIFSGGDNWYINKNNTKSIIKLDIKCLSPMKAEQLFLDEFFRLQGMNNDINKI